MMFAIKSQLKQANKGKIVYMIQTFKPQLGEVLG